MRLNVGDKTLLYYIGWNPGSTVRVHLFGGLAVSEDGSESFVRWSEAPIIELSNRSLSKYRPVGCKADDGYRMYYVSGVGWRHKIFWCNLKMAESEELFAGLEKVMFALILQAKPKMHTGPL